MSLRKQIPRLSARSIYKRNEPEIQQGEIVKKKDGRGRPRKYPLQNVENVLKLDKDRLQINKASKIQQDEEMKKKDGQESPKKSPVKKVKKNLKRSRGKDRPPINKEKNITPVKRRRPSAEDNSSEADCSSSANSSENYDGESEFSEEVITKKNKKGNFTKNKKVNNGDQENEREKTIRKMKGNSNKTNFAKKIEKEDDEEYEEVESDVEDEEDNDESEVSVEGEEDSEEDDEEEENEELEVSEEQEDSDEEEDENLLYSFAEQKTSPVKKKRKLTNDPIAEKKLDSKEEINKVKDTTNTAGSINVNSSKQKKLKLNKSCKQNSSDQEYSICNGDAFSLSHISSNDVDTNDFSSNDFHPGNTNKQFSTIQKLKLPGILSSSNPKSKISSYIEGNRAAKCGNFAAQEAFQWLISPMHYKAFFRDIFEQQPYHVPRKNPHYYHGLFSCNDLETMLRENNLNYDEQIDVLKYENLERVYSPLKGRAIYSNVWDDFKEGYSIRVRNPQTYNKKLWNICSLLQEFFSNVVGVNLYLTPPNSQGFPPHYDDIDAFIVQTEGSKKWKIYTPRNPNETLARYSSKDFTPDEINDPMYEITLKAGDFLYIPRGFIHQAETEEDEHSLHLTFSSNQLNTWGDLLVEALGKAMDHAILNEVDLRKSLPKDYTDYVGTAVSNMNFSEQRTNFIRDFHRLAKRCLSYLSADEGVDSHALKVIHTALPPVLSKVEKSHSIHGNGSQWKNGAVKQISYPKLNTRIQLLRRRNIRLVIEEGIGKIYHTFENERDPRPLPEYGIEIDHPFVEINLEEEVPAFTFLLKHAPNFVEVYSLPINKKSAKLSFVRTLYESGLLMTEDPLNFKKEDHSSSTTN